MSVGKVKEVFQSQWILHFKNSFTLFHLFFIDQKWWCIRQSKLDKNWVSREGNEVYLRGSFQIKILGQTLLLRRWIIQKILGCLKHRNISSKVWHPDLFYDVFFAMNHVSSVNKYFKLYKVTLSVSFCQVKLLDVLNFCLTVWKTFSVRKRWKDFCLLLSVKQLAIVG